MILYLILTLVLVCQSNGSKFSLNRYGHCKVNDKTDITKRCKRSSLPVIFDSTHSILKWNKKNITYGVSQYSEQLSQEFVDEQIFKAFQLWADYTDLEFLRLNTSGNSVDIDIRFCRGEHNDSTPFRSHDLAHAFSPETELGGDIHFNDDYTGWHEGTTFLHTSTHEIGHALGLSHNSLTFSIMSPYQGHAAFPVHLSLEDIRAVQALYGSKPYQRISVMSRPKTLVTIQPETQKPTTLKSFPSTSTIRSAYENITTTMESHFNSTTAFSTKIPHHSTTTQISQSSTTANTETPEKIPIPDIKILTYDSTEVSQDMSIEFTEDLQHTTIYSTVQPLPNVTTSNYLSDDDEFVAEGSGIVPDEFSNNSHNITSLEDKTISSETAISITDDILLDEISTNENNDFVSSRGQKLMISKASCTMCLIIFYFCNT